MPAQPRSLTHDDAASAPRRGRPGYDRETLLAVCVEVFNRHGYDATSMGTLSSHLGISKSAIYHHVASKEEILEQRSTAHWIHSRPFLSTSRPPIPAP